MKRKWPRPKPRKPVPPAGPMTSAPPPAPPGPSSSPANQLGNPQSRYESERIRELAGELAARRFEALRLYEPLPAAAPFHECAAPEVLVYGSNRAGKTLAVMTEVARAVTAQDPYAKYPVANGRAYIVGKDSKHVAEVFYKKLFRAGAFKIIRDQQTGMWRSVRP